MSDAHGEDFHFKQHVRTYINVFVALMVLTVTTVTASYFHFVIPLAITLALIIAIVKGSLVASFFMHLVGEKKLVFWVLLLTVVFFVALMALPVLNYLDRVR